MSMNGDYRSLAEACGEREHATAWVAGIDFDPSDPEEMETMRLVWAREEASALARAEAENARLRSVIAELTGSDDY